jgi:hypothetical protein
MATAMQRYWRNQGITEEQREAVVEETGTDPTNDPEVSIDNTVATETTDSGQVTETVTVEPDAGATAVTEADTSDLPAYASETGFYEEGSDTASDSEESTTTDPMSEASDSGGSSNTPTGSGSGQTPLPSVGEIMSDPRLVAAGVAVAVIVVGYLAGWF